VSGEMLGLKFVLDDLGVTFLSVGVGEAEVVKKV
jgi:hypothetical protein